MEDAASGVQGWNLSLVLSVVSTLVACLALIRPEIATRIRRLLNKLEFYPAGRLEIGFSSFGPLIGLHGTLVGQHSDQLVTSMVITVVRKRDNATHSFEWAVLRSTNFAQSAQQLELAAAFMVRIAEPRKINIQFHDQGTKDQFFGDVITLNQEFRKHLSDNNFILSSKSDTEAQNLRQQFRTQHNSLFLDTYGKLGECFYWEKGIYLATLVVHTKNPKKEFPYQFEFSLSEEESKSLSLNKIAIIEEALQAQNIYFNLAYPKFD